jgi:cell division protein ZapA
MNDNKISLEIQIADRRYPLRVAPNEEKILRQAEQEIKEKLAYWQSQVSVKESQDYLALALLTTLVEDIKARKDRETKLTFFRTKVNSMNKRIEALSLKEDTNTGDTEE